MSIRARLLGLVLALALPLVVIASAALYHAYRSEQAAIRNLLQDTSRALALAADREIDRARAILDLQAHSLSMARDDLRGFHKNSIQLIQETGQWMWLARPDGEVLLSTAFPFGQALPVSPRAQAYRRIAQTGRAELSGVFVGAATGRLLLAMEIPVVRDGEVRYILGISIPVDNFQKLTEGMNLPSAWTATILDRDGRIIGRSRDAQLHLYKPAPEPIASLFQAVPEGVIGIRTVDDVPVT